jgi:hypothetical protein
MIIARLRQSRLAIRWTCRMLDMQDEAFSLASLDQLDLYVTRGNTTRGNTTRGNTTRGNTTRGNTTRGNVAMDERITDLCELEHEVMQLVWSGGEAISILYPDETDAPKEGNMKTVYSALVVFSAVMLVASSVSPANAAFKRSYAECRDLANERGFSPGNGRKLGYRGRFVHECRLGRQN